MKTGQETEFFSLEVELPSGRTVEIEVKVRAEWENSGIGDYELWGHKGFDSGVDSLELTSHSWKKLDFTKEEIEVVEEEIGENIDGWIKEMKS